ncbi:MAG TPA: plasmid pRiA4b ORF-3 family protein [bacterium]|nr:plasmid pRiA4b ORF-3 family protein [bacterium]
METKTIQLKIHLQETDCERIIQCPDDFSFEMLHYIIQESFGWENEHLYEFKVFKKNRRTPFAVIEKENDEEDSFFESTVEKLNVKDTLLNQFLNSEKKYLIIYEYDFGDSWQHLILFEKSLQFDENKQLVCCVGGSKKCPPEDCGGIPGYYNILDVLKKKRKNEDDNELLEWLGDYNPDDFDVAKTNDRLTCFTLKKETPKSPTKKRTNNKSKK